MEKMPSASNSPVMGRKTSSNVESETDGKAMKKVPLSVASMVRRFETSNKTRGGDKSTSVTAELMQMERSNSQKLKEIETSSSLSSSPSSSQGHLNETKEEQRKSESSDKIKTTKTNQNKTVSFTKTFLFLKIPPQVALAFTIIFFRRVKSRKL